jgi:hypothetical protein
MIDTRWIRTRIVQILLLACLCLILALVSCKEEDDSDSVQTTSTSNSSVFYLTSVGGIVADGDIIYAAAGGYYSQPGQPATTKWAVYKTSDGGSSWTSMDYIFAERPADNNYAQSVYVHSTGSILAGGLVSDLWGIRRSTDSGATWTQVDSYSLSTDGNSKIYDMDKDSTSNIYAVGTVFDASHDRRWIVRKSTDNGVNWTLSDNYITNEDPTYNSTILEAGARGVVVDMSDNIFVTGTLQKELSDAIVWIVRKSDDGGASWTTVDEYQYTGSYKCFAMGIDKNSSDHLFVAGSCTPTGEAARWIVRRSIDGGTTWTTIEDYQLASGNNSAANGIRVDAGNNIYVTGSAMLYSYYNPYWITRKSADGGATWTTVDNFGRISYRSNFGYKLEVDNTGNIYASGTCANANYRSGFDWVIRKSTDAGATWTTVLELTYDDIL